MSWQQFRVAGISHWVAEKQKHAHDSSVVKGIANDLAVFGPRWPLKRGSSTSNLFSMSKEAKDKPNCKCHQELEVAGACGGDTMGRERTGDALGARGLGCWSPIIT